MTLAPAPQSGLLHDLDTREGCISAATSAIKDYRGTMLLVVESWVSHDFGHLQELADAIGKSRRTLQSYQTDLRKAGRLDPSPKANKGSRDRSKNKVLNSAPYVENEEPIDVEVEVMNGPTPEEIRQKLRAKQSPATETNVRRPEPDQPSPGHLEPGDRDDTLAQHYDLVQQSDEPDSYKQAQLLISQFERLLGRGVRDGWSESAFDSLRIDLLAYARTCANCSVEYRERLHEGVKAARASVENSIQGGEV